MYVCYFAIISFLKEGGPSFDQLWIPFTPKCYVSTLVKIGPVLMEKKFKYRRIDEGQWTIRKGHLSLQLRWAKKGGKLELIVTPHVKVYKNLLSWSFTVINPCDQASTFCPSSKCVPTPLLPPFYFCTGCPSGKTGDRCTIGMLLTIRRTRRIFCAEIVEGSFSSFHIFNYLVWRFNFSVNYKS